MLDRSRDESLGAVTGSTGGSHLVEDPEELEGGSLLEDSVGSLKEGS